VGNRSFPLLEYDEDEGRYTAVHHPFTAPNEADLALLESTPGKVRSQAYDMILNGTEIGGGSIRIHQKDGAEPSLCRLGYFTEGGKG